MRAGSQKRTIWTWLRDKRYWFWGWLLEDRATEGLGGPPNMHRFSPRFSSRQHGMSNGIKEFGLHFDNDAFDILIYTKYTDEAESKWRFSIAAEDFRKIALWYLWRWAWGEWFGLRRRLFYWRLHIKVSRFRQPSDQKN